MASSTIEVALSSDRRFYPGLLVSACSMAENISRGCDVVFHVIDGGIGAELRQDLERRLKKLNSRSRVNWLSVNEDVFAGLPEWRGYGKMTWARLMLSRLLPHSDWVIYYDVDYLCLADMAVLWQARDENVSLMSTSDCWSLTVDSEKAWTSAHGLKYDAARNFCAGFCFFNLRRIRECGYDKKLLDVALKYSDAPSVDQSVLNTVFNSSDELRLLPRKWQAYALDMTREDVSEQNNLHFSGEAPWVCVRRNRVLDDAAVFWFRYYAKLHGITTWKAMRKFYSAFDVIVYRSLFLAFSHSQFLRSLLFAYFHAIGRHESIKIYTAWLRRIRLPEV